jgi:hypothetical protein
MTEANGMAEILKRLEQLERENTLLTAVLQNTATTTAPEGEVINNGWRPLFNPKRRNPDNMDWTPGSDKRLPRNLHTGDGMWEWGYEDPDTGKVKWSGKLIGERPPGPPVEPPVPIEKLREHLKAS